jgi:hypothetical protein
VTVCSYVNRGQRRGIPGEYQATQAQTNEMAAKKRLLRRLSTTGNSNLPIALSEVFLVFVGLLIQIAHRAWVNCPYGANSNGHISPSQDISPTPIFRKENLTRFALTGLELARPADWRQNMTNHKTRTLILGLFFEARGPPYAFYLISLRPLDEPRNVGNVCPVYNSSQVPAWDEHVIVFVP